MSQNFANRLNGGKGGKGFRNNVRYEPYPTTALSGSPNPSSYTESLAQATMFTVDRTIGVTERTTSRLPPFKMSHVVVPILLLHFRSLTLP